MVERHTTVFEYFDIKDDIRLIRQSQRFQDEIASLFEGEITIALNTKESALIIVGVWKADAKDNNLATSEKRGMYHFAYAGGMKGCFYRAQIVF